MDLVQEIINMISYPDFGGFISFFSTVIFVYIILFGINGNWNPLKILDISRKRINKIEEVHTFRKVIVVVFWFAGFIGLWFTIREIELVFY